MLDVETAYLQCEQVIKQHSKTFFKAFSLLPKDKKQAVWAVYAFCRIVDDIVDEGHSPHEELHQFEMNFKKFLKGSIPHDAHEFMWIALKDAFKKYQLEEAAFFDMIKGQRMDLVKTKYYSMDEVVTYSYHVASSVGLMLLPILAPDKVNELREGAIALGLGMQITNILRDVGEDLDRDRMYLPKELMDRYQYHVRDLEMAVINPAFITLWEHMAQEAEGYYLKALETMHYYPLSARTPVKASALLYREILTIIRKKNYQVFTEKQFVTNEEKSMILESISG
ncbi:phytoene/squalene synthase family protein [Bacillus weihaiensis]|uniref:phytoene/squalene synthase family protein n=1 Tax=Bacillus weihaiensis TaxID=1547283 RepID=UPI002357477C|nr:phytoene/squalene synthase family protein [Bacillus weihaiensis]